MSKIRTYQLYLSTQVTSPTSNNIVPINVTNRANAVWQVDFKSLFGNDFDKYKRCSVRAELISESWNSGNTDWNNYSGYLGINLPSTSNASTTLGTPIMQIFPTNVPVYDNPQTAYHCDTLGNNQGVDIAFPSANQLINLMFVNNDAMTLMTNTPHYQILLQFELSDSVE